MIRLEDMDNMTTLPFGFEDGRWFLKSEVGSRKSED
jgi:hypothetical protein